MSGRKKKQSVLEWGLCLVNTTFPDEYDPNNDPCFSKFEKDNKKLTKKEQWLLQKTPQEQDTRIEMAKRFANASVAERLSWSEGGSFMSGADVFSHTLFEGSEFLNDLGNIPCSRVNGKIGTAPVPRTRPQETFFKKTDGSYIVLETNETKTCPITWDEFHKGDTVFQTHCCDRILAPHAVENDQCPFCTIGEGPNPK